MLGKPTQLSFCPAYPQVVQPAPIKAHLPQPCRARSPSAQLRYSSTDTSGNGYGVLELPHRIEDTLGLSLTLPCRMSCISPILPWSSPFLRCVEPALLSLPNTRVTGRGSADFRRSGAWHCYHSCSFRAADDSHDSTTSTLRNLFEIASSSTTLRSISAFSSVEL